MVIARKKTVTQRLSLTSAVGGGGGVRLGQRRVREETRKRERERSKSVESLRVALNDDNSRSINDETKFILKGKCYLHSSQ